MISGLLILSGIIYALVILLSWYGWRKTKIFNTTKNNFTTKVSVIIPARNEEKNILKCLNAISQQTFPKHLAEIIVVDDNSEDKTQSVVAAWIATQSVNAKIISAEDGAGKKHALNLGIKNATGELIITTDADCTMEQEWLSTIVGYYEEYSPDMIAGMVGIKEENNFSSVFQSLELTGLTAIGAAGIYFHHPLLCNGANLAYRKNIFEETGGFDVEEESASGDDTMMMFRVSKRNPGAVHFLKSKEAMVFTNAAQSFNTFFLQRKRWGSKVLMQGNSFSVIIAIAVVLFHISLLLSLIIAAAGIISWKIFLLVLVLKIIPEIILLTDVLAFSGKKKSFHIILISQIIYPFYLVVTALLSQMGTYEWKGRRVK